MTTYLKKAFQWVADMTGRYKYWIVSVIGVLVVGFIGENSIMQQVKNKRHISRIEKQIEELNEKFTADSLRLSELYTNPEAIEKIARERYFMKSDDEDIFVLSDDAVMEETVR